MSPPGRVAVIGVGVLGASVGWNLAQRGVDVVFVDAAQPGEGVTDWSFSWVNASNKTVSRPYYALNVAGMAAHRELAAAIGADGWWYPTGHLRWAGDEAARAAAAQTAELLADWDYRVEVFTGAQVRRRFEAALAVPDDVPVLFFPDEGWVHGRHLVGRLVGEAARAGARCRFGAAVSEIAARAGGGAGGWELVLADGTSLAVDTVVNAAGPSAAGVAEFVGRKLPMRYEPGAVARLRCEGGQVPIGRAMHAPHVEMRPDGEASVVLHSREVDALIDTGPDEDGLGRLLQEAARRVVPELGGARVVRTRVSNRPIPADGFPSVGAVASLPGYYEAVSHSGITLGPVLGRLLASEILTGVRDPLLADFAPDRFGT